MIKLSLSILGLAAILAGAQDVGGDDLARLLARDSTRQDAVNQIVASGRTSVPLLLSWARKPPTGVEKYDLYLGLAEVFGQLRARDAIPFLIKNITLQNWPPSSNTWMKTPEVIEQRMPAVAALIKIGPDASRAVLHTPLAQLTPEERLAAIFVVSRVKQVPEAREFLISILGQANMERLWAEEGLRVLNEPK